MIILKHIHFLNTVPLKTLNFFLKNTFEDRGICLILFTLFWVLLVFFNTVKCMRGLKSVVGGIKADNKIRGYKADN